MTHANDKDMSTGVHDVPMCGDAVCDESDIDNDVQPTSLQDA